VADPITASKVALLALKSKRVLKALGVVFAALVVSLVVLVVALTTAVQSLLADECAAPPAPGTSGANYVSQEPSRAALSDIPADSLALYREAASEQGLDWAILAAIGAIESGHGQNMGPSSAGALGPMQFMPATWEFAGVDGDGDGDRDVMDPKDAIPAAAGYLRDNGAPEDYHAALFAYNHAGWYVEDVLAKAEEYRAAPEGDAVLALAPAWPDLRISGLFAMREAHAAEGSEGTVGDPGETDYSAQELETLRLVNAYREENGLGPLVLSDAVSTAAARYAHDMAKHDAYSVPAPHVTGSSDWYPEGADLTARMNAEGYFAGRYGENIAAGQGSAERVFEAWRGSPSHDAMMLDPEMRVVGIGLVENPSTSYGEFWVTDFGSERDETSRPVPEAARDGGSGDARAVFPLPGAYLDSYSDDWGAPRGHGTHEGTDLFAPDGTPIYSVTDGTVVPVSGADGSGWNPLGGWTVMIEATESVGPIRAGDTLYYAHMLEPTPLKPGDEVEAGQQVGRVGSTGEGPLGTLLPEGRGEHLHLGWYDPTMQRAETASGAMNPFPLLEWLKANGGTATGEGALPAAPGACPEGTGLGSGGASGLADPAVPGSGSAEELLRDLNFQASPGSVEDLRTGIVDERLVAALQAITEEHAIYVSAIKTDHPFGPTIPESYIGASGVPNSHYYGRAADIAQVDGRPVEGNGSSEAVLDVGRILAGIPPGERPDEIVGPPEWQAELGYPREAGFVTDPGLNAAHSNHVHVGLQSDSGTANTR